MTTTAQPAQTAVIHIGGLGYAGEKSIVERVLAARPGVLEVHANAGILETRLASPESAEESQSVVGIAPASAGTVFPGPSTDGVSPQRRVPSADRLSHSSSFGFSS